MAAHFPALIVIIPLLAAVGVALIGLWHPKVAFPLTVLGLVGALLASIKAVGEVAALGTIHYRLGGWEPPRGIEFRLDQINTTVCVVIATVALIAAIWSHARVPEETREKTVHYYTLFLLLCTGLLGMTITNDAFNLYVLVEVSSLTSYALIAMGSSRRGTLAAFNYVIMGTIGASFYLLGVGYLYIRTGSLNMSDIAGIIESEGLVGSSTIQVAFILILTGLFIKMAFFPLHGWLSGAYTFSPSTTGALLAPLMTKVSVYVMIRVMLGVFGAGYCYAQLNWELAIVWLAVIAIVAGSVMALAQTQFKRMLCYLIVAEVGYMVGGAWLGNENGLVGASYHIVSDAFMTLALFLIAGVFFRTFRSHQISALSGQLGKMPVTFAALALAGAAMVGVPPTCGFFSKWYLIQGGIEAGRYEFVVALLISSLINAVLFIRIFERAYFPAKVTNDPTGNESEDTHHPVDHGDDDHGHSGPRFTLDPAPKACLVALVLAAVSLLIVGLANAPIAEFLREAIRPYLAGV